MKLDQDTLKKHRFWFLLLLFVPLWLIIVILLLTSVAGNVSAGRTAVEGSNKKLDSFGSPKNQNFIDPLKQKEKALQEQKNKVWKVASDGQDGLMTWPGNQRAELGKNLKSAYFGDEIDYNQRLEYGENLYKPQFDELTPLIQPAYFHSNSMETVVRPVANWKNPTTEELWLAQEDFWVKREMLGVVRSAIDSVAKFSRVVDPNEKDKSKPRRIYRNPNWELEVIIEQNARGQKLISEKSTLKNINPNQRLQTLNGVIFRALQKTKEGRVIASTESNWRIEGEPVKYNAATTVNKSVLIDTINPDEMEIEQVLTWATSPIKRVDRIEVGNRLALSSRLSSWGLVSKQIGKKDEKEGEAGGGPRGGGPGPMAGGPMEGGSSLGPGPMGGGVGVPPGVGGPMGGGNNTAAVNPTPNGLERDRYLDISDQARRMPVAMVLVVDQAYIPDVLTAFANSRLRLWTTQWEWQHVRGITPPPLEGALAEGGRGPEGPMGGVGRPPRPMGGFVPPPGMGPGPGPMGGFGGNQMTSFEEDDPNLVELAVYNLATLYERYPPRSAKPEDNPSPGGPGTPMPPKP